jgi:predicted Zn-dependent protease
MELNSAIALAPDHSGLRKRRAELLLQTGDIGNALADAAEAVILDHSDPAAKALLGLTLLDADRAKEATACLSEARAADPTNPDYCKGLAAAQEASGDADAALATLLAATEIAPARVDLRNSAIMACLRQRNFTWHIGSQSKPAWRVRRMHAHSA